MVRVAPGIFGEVSGHFSGLTPTKNSLIFSYKGIGWWGLEVSDGFFKTL